MHLKVIGSSSRGNCYLLENDIECLIVECGMQYSTVKKVLNFNIGKIAGAIVSHRHGDHSKYLNQYINSGIMVYTSMDVFNFRNVPLRNPLANIIKPGRGIIMGGFSIFPLSVEHDVECYAFVIKHKDFGNLLFVTDTFYFDYLINGLNHIMIECNFAEDILDNNIEKGITYHGLRSRLISGHMELNTCKEILSGINLNNVRGIYLCHLSRNNSDKDRFVKEIKDLTCKPVFVASRGMSIAINKEPY